VSLTRKWIPSPNYSSRGGAGVRLIVIHTAEGATTIESLGSYFASSSAGVSSHVGIDDKAGVVGEYVKRGNKAWTQGNANPVAVSAELCAFAKWTRDQWMSHPKMLDNCARWIAEEAAAYGLPITKLSASAAQGSGRGVCQHADLGSWGGGHWDCGSGFPMDHVLDLARGGAGTEEEMGYPDWFYPWLDWYLNVRPEGKRPASAPDQIPQWAWDAQATITKIANKYGMTDTERNWLAWYIDTPRDDATRPDGAPQSIPGHWWEDEAFVLTQIEKLGK
jgi:hypothetical protein